MNVIEGAVVVLLTSRNDRTNYARPTGNIYKWMLKMETPSFDPSPRNRFVYGFLHVESFSGIPKHERWHSNPVIDSV